ncbi:hypothetical protein [Microbacterium lacus]|uniref:hypothetical protein n=1 Tax=Microbacterium lacus TaxID=415217 RepID=UPI000C2CAAA6|nr:hypothetical protein [Microbacterium lacus]
MSKYVERTREVCRYPFTDRYGRLRFEKVRYEILNPKPDGRTKTFRYFNPDALPFDQKRKPAIADSIIYNLPAVLEGVSAGEVVHWTEGEADCDALTAQGYVATSHHQGAGHVTPEQAAWLRGAERVVLWADRDIPGAYDVWRRWQLLLATGVPEEGIVIVVALAGKDVRDHLNAGHTVAEAVPMAKSTVTTLAAQHSAATARKAGYRAV